MINALKDHTMAQNDYRFEERQNKDIRKETCRMVKCSPKELGDLNN